MPHRSSSDLALVTRKIVGPSLPPMLLHRQRLIMQLREAITMSFGTQKNTHLCKLILLSAPAGYGKTTLLADFAQQTTLPCCWYFLDPTDRDPLIFLKILLASIHHHFTQFGITLQTLLENLFVSGNGTPDRPSLEAFIHTLASAIQTDISEPFIIIVCNYHEVNESEIINHLVYTLLQHLPAQCLLVIESRTIPNFKIAHLIASQALFGLGSTALQFTEEELRDLVALQQTAPLEDKEIEHLMASFDGWIAGLLLGTRLGNAHFSYTRADTQRDQRVSIVQHDKRHLFAYVVHEVFKQEPAIFHFLKEASILQYMTPLLCNSLLDITNAGEHLHYAEQQGLFVSYLGDNPQPTYSCHPLLRESLYDILHSQSLERFIALHQRAARLLYTEHQYDRAIFHALEGGLEDFAAQIITKSYQHLLLQGHTETVAHWLRMLPETLIEKHPRLLLIQASLALAANDHENAHAYLETASAVLTSQSTSIDTDIQQDIAAELFLARGKALFQSGAYLDAQTMCQKALTHLSPDDNTQRAEAYRYLGFCANMLGDFATGISYFHKALQLWGSHAAGRHIAELQSALGSSYNLLGNIALAEHHVLRALSYWQNGPATWGTIHNLLRLGLIKHHQGDLAEAEALYSKALIASRETPGSQRGEAYTLVSLGDLFQEQGNYQQSLVMTEEGLLLARSLKDTYLSNTSLCLLAITYTLLGDTTTALFYVSEVEVPVTHEETPGYEQTLCDLTMGTILLYQQQYEEAAAHLSAMRTVFKTMNLKREYLQATLRTAMCSLGRQQVHMTITLLEDVRIMLAKTNHYEFLVQTELSRLPDLLQLVKTHEQMTQMRTLLHIKSEAASISSHSPNSIMSHSRLKIQAFGEPAVFLAGELVTSWHRARTMELFFFLLEKGGSLRKEQIMDAFWPDGDENADQTLRATVHYLRKAIGDTCVITKKGTYTLNLATLYGTDIHYDVALFQQQYKNANEAMKLGNTPTAKSAFSAMVALHQGDFAQSFYSDWCIRRRDALRLMCLEALQHLAQITWQEEQTEECIIHWQHMLTIDPCLEEAHYGLMRCYLRQGKRGRALRQYQRCYDILNQELGVQPGSTIQHLYERLTSATISQGITAKVPPQPEKKS